MMKDYEMSSEVTDPSSESHVTNGVEEASSEPLVVENDMEIDDDEKYVGKSDCDALYKKCIKIQTENATSSEQLKRIRKVIRRIQKENRFLIKKLDGFGDNYTLAKIKLMEEEELKIAEALERDDEDVEIQEPKKTTKKRKIKVKRLQNAPKKPSNAFLMFCQKNRSVVQQEHLKTNKTEINRQEMTRKLAEIWKTISKDDKKTYYEMYEKDKLRYAQEMKDFESLNSANSQNTEEISPETPEGNLVINDVDAVG